MQTILTMLANWKTAVPATLSLICGSADMLGMIPAPYQNYAIHLCLFLVAVGLIAAKDADRSNALNPTAIAQKVGGLLLPILLLGLTGCGSTFQFPKDLKDPAKVQAVIVQLKADAQTVAIAGCALVPVAEVLIPTALQILPAGTTIDAINAGLKIAEPDVEAFCAKVQQLAAVSAS